MRRLWRLTRAVFADLIGGRLNSLGRSVVYLSILMLTNVTLGAATDSRPESMRVDVGGYKLHIRCMGEGKPAVILDAGLGGSAADWNRVQRGLAATTRVCTYDRAGYGNSDPGPFPRTSSRIAAELRTLLEGARIPPPYILVGHSFGGYNMRMFAGLYPDETVGLVLVDAPHEGQVEGAFESHLMRQLDPAGFLRQLWKSEVLNDLLEVDWEPLAALLGVEIANMRTMLGELVAFRESGLELKAMSVQSNIPLVAIMHGIRVMPEGTLGDQMERKWLELQRDLVSHHKDGTFIIAEDSTHLIPFHEPELIVDAVRGLVDKQR